MQMPQNRFLELIRQGRPAWGCWLGIPDPTVAEIAAASGFDWLLIDHEHAPFELSDVLAHLRALEPYPVAQLVRPVDSSPSLLKRFLEMGAQTFIIPMIDTPEQAAACAEALYYPPRGRRGVGTSLARAARWNGVDDYLAGANDEICLLVQAESTTSLANLERIAKVEGVHGVFIGPSDLAASMGKLGQGEDPELINACIDAIRRVKRTGKLAGILTLNQTLIKKSISAGADFIATGVDTLLLSGAMRAAAAAGHCP
ncbi:HpcH/HpaI aldolase/citrate lyase family protein [Pseudohaliea sp.]|uniref:HpcH/HpaI aldolase family protein n=1 Tax=Pseudohaliea sp. TaxID=2740289 RepID=UPI0032EAB3EB